jgi:hypothetical protein
VIVQEYTSLWAGIKLTTIEVTWAGIHLTTIEVTWAGIKLTTIEVTWAGIKLTTIEVTSTDCIGRCKLNYHGYNDCQCSSSYLKEVLLSYAMTKFTRFKIVKSSNYHKL